MPKRNGPSENYFKKPEKFLIPPVEKKQNSCGNLQYENSFYNVPENFIEDCKNIKILALKFSVLLKTVEELDLNREMTRRLIINYFNGKNFTIVKNLIKQITKLYNNLNKDLLCSYLNFDKPDLDLRPYSQKYELKELIRLKLSNTLNYSEVDLMVYDSKAANILYDLFKSFDKHIENYKVC